MAARCQSLHERVVLLREKLHQRAPCCPDQLGPTASQTGQTGQSSLFSVVGEVRLDDLQGRNQHTFSGATAPNAICRNNEKITLNSDRL